MAWNLRNLFIVLALAIGGFESAPSSESPPAEAEASPALGEARALTTGEAAIVLEVMELFDGAGLVLPAELVVSFHENEADCGGNLGLSTREGGIARVRVCWSHEDAGVRRIVQTQALVHELAHAWAAHNVDEQTRAAFVELSASGSWNARSTSWQERGTERAADLITWALLDPPVLFVEFDGSECENWGIAFEQLTGTTAPAAITEAC